MEEIQDLIGYEKSIREEADSILFEGGLHQLISKYGKVGMAGSYPLKMMFKRDLDITLISSELQPPKFFELGGRIADHLGSHFLYYHNTRIKALPLRPTNALYFGVSFQNWKIDLWVTSEEWWKESEIYMNNILTKLTNEKKLIILEIKKEFSYTKDYGRKFSSKQIYSSVLDHGVTTVKQFAEFIDQK